jgi:hypothetical protein
MYITRTGRGKGSVFESGALEVPERVSNRDGTGTVAFYNLSEDPLEEYPLTKPAGCSLYSNGVWSPADEGWHFCRLTEVVRLKSFLQIPIPL